MNIPIQWSEVPLFEAVEYDDTGHAYRHDMPPGTAKWSPNHHDNIPMPHWSICALAAVGMLER